MRIKPIQFVPTAKVAERVQKMADKLRTSKASVAELAVETMLDGIDIGAFSIVNGRVIVADASKLQAS